MPSSSASEASALAASSMPPKRTVPVAASNSVHPRAHISHAGVAGRCSTAWPGGGWHFCASASCVPRFCVHHATDLRQLAWWETRVATIPLVDCKRVSRRAARQTPLGASGAAQPTDALVTTPTAALRPARRRCPGQPGPSAQRRFPLGIGSARVPCRRLRSAQRRAGPAAGWRV
jgi:hypothetical protein